MIKVCCLFLMHNLCDFLTQTQDPGCYCDVYFSFSLIKLVLNYSGGEETRRNLHPESSAVGALCSPPLSGLGSFRDRGWSESLRDRTLLWKLLAASDSSQHREHEMLLCCQTRRQVESFPGVYWSKALAVFVLWAFCFPFETNNNAHTFTFFN